MDIVIILDMKSNNRFKIHPQKSLDFIIKIDKSGIGKLTCRTNLSPRLVIY